MHILVSKILFDTIVHIIYPNRTLMSIKVIILFMWTGSLILTPSLPPCSFRKHVVFGKIVQGFDVLKKIESVDVEDGVPTVTVKIINCGEFNEGRNYKPY